MPFALLVTFGLFVSCATPPAVVNLTDVDYGPAPANHEKLIKDYFEPRLKDPFSAQYKFQAPFKGYTRGAPIAGGKINNVGWVVLVHVNAKNSYGGYTGWELHRFLIRDEKLLGEFSTNPYFSEHWLKGSL